MNILFLCSSLNPGKDGVGDYTRRLAGMLRERGHEVCMASLHETPGSLEASDDEDERVLRLTNGLPWKKRADQLGRFFQSHQPDRASLQYVPYGFQKKGLPFALPAWLASAVPVAGWHVMFHELWVGITRSSLWRHKLAGCFQRSIAKNLIRRLKPVAVHTSNPLYLELLQNVGIRARRLPLFGAIDLDESQQGWMADRLAEVGITPRNRKEWFVAGMFGSCYPDFPLERQILGVSTRAFKSKKRIAVFGIGGGVGTGEEWEKRARQVLPGVVVRHFGRQDAARVSAFLQTLDLAMPSTPIEFLGKSSAAASMVLHGASLDNSYRVDMPEYRHLRLADWPQEDLFWPLEKVAVEIESSLAAFTPAVISK
jgi:hypothetical protein